VIEVSSISDETGVRARGSVSLVESFRSREDEPSCSSGLEICRGNERAAASAFGLLGVVIDAVVDPEGIAESPDRPRGARVVQPCHARRRKATGGSSQYHTAYTAIGRVAERGPLAPRQNVERLADRDARLYLLTGEETTHQRRAVRPTDEAYEMTRDEVAGLDEEHTVTA
jgi:hypothetical protein